MTWQDERWLWIFAGLRWFTDAPSPAAPTGRWSGAEQKLTCSVPTCKSSCELERLSLYLPFNQGTERLPLQRRSAMEPTGRSEGFLFQTGSWWVDGRCRRLQVTQSWFSVGPSFPSCHFKSFISSPLNYRRHVFLVGHLYSELMLDLQVLGDFPSDILKFQCHPSNTNSRRKHLYLRM